MSQKKKAQIVTIAVLACVVGAVIVKRWRPAIAERPATTAETMPQDVIYAMLDAARDGDVGKYLTSYTGQMETSLQQAVAESPDFRKTPRGWRIARVDSAERIKTLVPYGTPVQ